MSLGALDTQRLNDALALAEGSFGLTEPNPRVGCVIGLPDGTVLGRGATQQAGGPHAEVMALRDAQAQGHDVAGATAWVTLEPCAHHGRTPPCCDALVAARLARVVVALRDPFPQVNGSGIARLRAAGIEVDLAGGDWPWRAAAVNPGFLSRVLRGRPWVRTKIAASLDARTALPNGRSQWITSPEARLDGHRFRRRSSAVLTGIGTVLADDPRLDVRLDSPRPDQRPQPLRVVVDSQFRMPPSARILAPPGAVQVVGAVDPAQAQLRLAASGARLSSLPGTGGQVDLGALLQQLAEQGCNELHVEAGAGLNGALLRGGLVDELLLYTAPMLLGPGRSLAELPELEDLAQARVLRFTEATLVGPDLRVRALTASGLALMNQLA
jgi:diaminohydroxyphosphoribosylaminopyrimidine deaminase / 5-amino-6-(5-phosphoribosylamino)uracil reductase